MQQTAQALFLICETPLHAGSGSDLGIIDLPIQREKHTGFPKIESSGLKGSLREAFENATGIDKVTIHKVFGYDSDSADSTVKAAILEGSREYSGCLTLTDARLLLFPVKSQKGVFAWITCDRILSRFFQEMAEICIGTTLPPVTSIAKGSVGTGATIFVDVAKTIVGLEEYQYSGCSENQQINTLGTWLATNLFHANPKLRYWADKIKTDIVVLSDDDFADFVQHSTEVVTRTKINNETGTVSDTALFTEEYLPAESILYSIALFSPEFKNGGLDQAAVAKFYNDHLPTIFQIGGNATIGKGIVRTNKNPNQSNDTKS